MENMLPRYTEMQAIVRHSSTTFGDDYGFLSGIE